MQAVAQAPRGEPAAAPATYAPSFDPRDSLLTQEEVQRTIGGATSQNNAARDAQMPAKMASIQRRAG